MKIYNSLSRKKEEFIPLEPGKIKMYVCGPTVYYYFHIGNARTFLFFDVVRRYFEFKGFEVIYVQNITDIDDKLINQSIKEKIPFSEIAEKYIKAFFDDIKALGLKEATFYPKATEYMNEMIDLIAKLEKKGFAYETNGDVYFSVNSFKDYGKLSGKKLDELKTGARVEENLQKRRPADFTLWKKAKPGEPSWQSPWGKGRPGWHTECVVISQKILGDSFDIHCGAVDLIFPHHENEIAQAEALSGKPFVNYWMHGGFLNISGEKMSKSLDNFFLTRDVLKKFDAEAIRFFFLSKNYRSSIDFSEDILQESAQAMKNLYSFLQQVDYLSFMNENSEYSENQIQLKNEFIYAMDDDFNTAKAIAVMFKIRNLLAHNKESELKQYAHLLVELGRVLGFFSNLEEILKQNLSDISEELIELLIKYRTIFKQEKNWNYADQIREELDKLGVKLKDTKTGTEWSLDR